jgi:DNA-binding response OmpR family regulator
MTLHDRLLIVEDDPNTADLLARFLGKEGYRIVLAQDGRQAMELFASQPPDMVILDAMLPHVDGFDVCAAIRRTSQVPVLFLTARDEEADIVLGLGLGADDYVVKPFSPRELVARVKALLRRCQSSQRPLDDGSGTHSGLSYDPSKRRFTLRGESLELTPLEFALLRTLMASPGRIFLRGELLNTLYPAGDPVIDRVIDVHIAKLRQKLRDDPDRPTYIHTVRGLGYRFADQELK